MNTREIQNLIEKQHHYFASGQTREISFRHQQLEKLKDVLLGNETKIVESVKTDLGSSEFDAFFSEVGVALWEIDYALRRLKRWTRQRSIKSSLFNFPSSSYVHAEPYGVSLIIGPWNYPFNLIIMPLIGAMAAGNCAVIKPSELAENTSHTLQEIINNAFDSAYISVVEGGIDTSKFLLSQKVDYIFYTGSAAVGREVMKAAAGNLTPVLLELGGKNPCLVDIDIDIVTTARRIVWGKFLNAGQTCLAPDYLAVHRDIKTELLESMEHFIKEFYGPEPAHSQDYGRIISEKHTIRLKDLLEDGNIVTGGKVDVGERYVAPTIIDRIAWKDRIMENEVFGPILPVLEYQDLDQVLSKINGFPQPLAIYIFSRSRLVQDRVLSNTASGSVCINDVMVQASTKHLPFGGVGESGMGRYHGKASFDAFSYDRGVMKKHFIIDWKLRYPPHHKPGKMLRKMANYFS